MSKLDEAVLKVIQRYRLYFALSVGFWAILLISSGSWFGLAILAMVSIPLYVLGMHVLASMIQSHLKNHPALLRAHQIQILNEKLGTGELQAGTPELDEQMQLAGLKPMSVITETGPVFGKLGDTSLHEWVEAKEGSAGTPMKYAYVGQARFDEDGTIVNELNGESQYLVLNGILYELKPEPKKDEPAVEAS